MVCPDGSIDVLTTIKSLVNELDMRILISSHKLEDIELICDRAVFLKRRTFCSRCKHGGRCCADTTIVTVDHKTLIELKNILQSISNYKMSTKQTDI